MTLPHWIATPPAACGLEPIPADEPASDLAYLVAFGVARIAESLKMPRTAEAALAATDPDDWRTVARSLMVAAEGPLAEAAADAAMMLARGRLVAAADTLAIARGLTLRAWCSEMRAT